MLLFLGWPAGAQEQPESRFRFGGFGTLGLAWNSTDQAAFIRDVSQPRGATRTPDGRVDSRLGLQGDAQLTGTLQATLQVVSKYRYDATYTPDITWAFLGWSPQPEYRFRFGRLGVESFMNSDSRDVGYTYLLVRPPMEVFGVVPVTRLDGLDGTGTFAAGADSTLRFKAFFGQASEKMPLAAAGTATVLDLAGDRVQGLIAELQTGSWRARLGYAGLQIRTGFPAAVTNLQNGLETFARLSGNPQLVQTADALDFTGGTLGSYTAGLAWDDNPVQGQAMLACFRSDRDMLPRGWAGYVSAGYRLGKVVPYGLWSRVASESRPGLYLQGLPPAVAAQIRTLVDTFASSQSTAAAGFRWDFLAQADCKVQVERVQGSLPTRLWAQPQPGWDGRATVVSAVLDFVF